MITKEQFDQIDDCLNMIYAIGFDYDGYEKPESLKELIDELVEYARTARRILHSNDQQYDYIRKDDVCIALEQLATEELIGNDANTYISLPEALDRIEELT